MNVTLRDDMPFHPLKDLALITQIVSVPEILVVNENVPAKTLAELVALAKAEPGKLVFASTGHGGMPHMAMELLKLTAGIQLVHAPYTGAAPAVNDLLGGHVQMMFADVPVLLGNIQAGKLRALAIGSRTRIANLPSVATTAELGMPQVEADNWYGLVAPIATPQPILAKLQSAPLRSAALRRGQGQARRPKRHRCRQLLRGVFGLCEKRDRALGPRSSPRRASRSSERRTAHSPCCHASGISR